MSLRARGSTQPVFPALRRAVAALLGCDAASVTEATRYRDLGGDSLSALSLAELLRDVFAVDVTVSAVINPTSDLGTLASAIETAMAAGASATTGTTTSITADQLRQRTFRPSITTPPNAAEDEPRTVLLTGANGYLGRFLCLEQLDRLSSSGGKLICLVRGAMPRLLAAFDTGDEELTALFAKLSAERLEVLDGDLDAPRLELADETWRRLAAEVDLVLHAGALVNHLLPYEQLHGTNVAGTASIIELALTTKTKKIGFVSTVAALGDHASGEDDDIRLTHPSRELNSRYANGYGVSKWASEVLLRHAHEEFGLPVTVFRSDLVLAHPRFTGQLNVPDLFTRLLRAVVGTGLAPGSFYRTFHVMNPHEDGISLDTCVDWLIEAGHPVTRVADHHEWTERLSKALHRLPEVQRRESLLPLLSAFATPSEPHPGPQLPVARFVEALHEAGHFAPHLTRDLIIEYCNDFARLDQPAATQEARG